jgi:site-specific recombinase XerD
MHQFVKDPRIIERLRRGELGDHIDSYAALLSQQNYAPSSAYRQLLVISHFSQWLQRHGIEVDKVDETTLQKFLRTIPRKMRYQSGDAAALNRLLRLLRQQNLVPPKSQAPLSPQQDVVAGFAHYLLHERRLSQATLVNYQPFVDRFLSEQFEDGKVNLSSLRATDVTGFVQRHARRLRPTRAKLLVGALRSFFRHLQQRGEISAHLAACVPSVANWSLSALPRFLPTGAVQRVLQHCDRHTPVGKRNYAILLLLARLGLRACEVVALNLEDLNWDAGQITVKGKGGASVSLPLPTDVGEALAAYLRSGRPRCSSRRVFIRDRAPLTGFANSIAVSTLVMRALKKAGVNSTHKGAHVFRHTLATDMLRQGCSLDEIGELLRHQSPNTTAIYAKVDLAALHTLALPWPGGGR